MADMKYKRYDVFRCLKNIYLSQDLSNNTFDGFIVGKVYNVQGINPSGLYELKYNPETEESYLFTQTQLEQMFQFLGDPNDVKDHK